MFYKNKNKIIDKYNYIPKCIKPINMYLKIIRYNKNYYSKKNIVNCISSENNQLLNNFKNNINYKLIKYKYICDNIYFQFINNNSISIQCYIDDNLNDTFLNNGWDKIENLNFSHNNTLECIVLIVTNNIFNNSIKK